MMRMPLARAPFPELGVRPHTAGDAIAALALLKRDGAVIMSDVGHTAEDAKQLGHLVFGDSVLAIPEAAEVRDGGVQDRRYAGLSQHTGVVCTPMVSATGTTTRTTSFSCATSPRPKAENRF